MGPPTKGYAVAGPRPPTHWEQKYSLIFNVDPLTIGAGAVSDSVACHWILFSLLDCLVGPQWERICLVLLGLDVPQLDGTQVGLLLL